MGLFDIFGAQKKMAQEFDDAVARAGRYFMGLGVAKDYNKAVEECQTATRLFREIKKKDYESFYNIRAIWSACKLFGHGAEQEMNKADERKVLENVSQSSKSVLAVAFANFGLAYCYHNGISVEKDVGKAIEYYEKTLTESYAKSYMGEVIYLLGCMYLEGTEVIPDYGLAIHYLKQVIQKYPDAQEKIELAKRKKAEQETLKIRIRTLSALFYTLENDSEKKMSDNAEAADTIDDWLMLAKEYTDGELLNHDIKKALYCIFRSIVVGKDRNTIITIPDTIPQYAQKQLEEAKALIRGGKEFEKAACILEKLVENEACAEADYLLRNLSGYGEKYCWLERLCENKKYGDIAKTEKYPLVTCDIPTLAFWSVLGKQEALDCLEECFYDVFEFDMVKRDNITALVDFVFNENKLNDKVMRKQGLIFTVDQYKMLWNVAWVWCVRIHEYMAQKGAGSSMSRLDKLWYRLDFVTGESIDYDRKKYWLYQAEKADYLPGKLSLINDRETDTGKLSKYIEWAKEGVYHGISGAKSELELLQLVKERQIRWDEEIARSRREQLESQIEAEMNEYRKKLDNRERWFNYFADGNFITNKTDMFYRSLLGDSEGAMNDYMWSLWREKKEAEKKEKLLAKLEREESGD